MNNLIKENSFWNTIEKSIESKQDSNPARNSLYDISIAYYDSMKVLSKIDSYLEDPENYKKFMNYSTYKHYGIALNYFRDNSPISKENYKLITNLIELNLKLSDLEEKYENNKDKKYRDLLINILNTSSKEIKKLLINEIKRINIKEYIVGIKPENKISYLENMLSCSDTKIPLASLILDLLKTSL